jgi:hypothetical protein
MWHGMAWHGMAWHADAALIVRQQTHDRVVARAPSLLCSPVRDARRGAPVATYHVTL